MGQGLLIALAVWILISGADDLFIAIVRLLTCRRKFVWPTEVQLQQAPQRRIAIFVACWHEHRVIGQMLDRTVAAIAYQNYEIFVGVYPNDQPTVQAVAEAEMRHARVHMAVNSRDGPSSKGDNLNSIYRCMREFETALAVHFDVIVTHDAEDIVHAEALGLINWFSGEYQMVQIPVLALPTPWEFTHGLYCDEFAEFQSKDIPVRACLGGFLPSNGVGCGFSREALEALADTREGRIFDPDCVTEDYENGFRLHQMGYRQLFVPIRIRNGAPVATREYFPRKTKAAIRQRSRWVMGITMQGWVHHGWRASWGQRYWFFRDRKGLPGNLLSPVTNAVFVYGGVRALLHLPAGFEWLPQLYLATLILAAVQGAQRIGFSTRFYGLPFGLLAPLRTLWGNVINFAATCSALRQFLGARVSGGKLAWRKTEHDYPIHQAARERPRLGEVLVRMQAVTLAEIDAVLIEHPQSRLGERLMELGKLSEDSLYRALSSQAGIPYGAPQLAEISPEAARVIPAEVARHWKVLPYRIGLGQLHLATTEIPTDEMARELARVSTLDLRFRLLTPREFRELAELTGAE